MKLIKKKNLLFVASILSLLSLVFIILAYSKFYFHSDCMGYLFQAQEQFAQHTLFPKRFHYTTTIFGFSTSIFMLPFVGVVKNEYLLHELGSIIAMMVVVCLIFVLFKEKKEFGAIVTVLLFIPLSLTYEDMLFFQSAYINTWILILVHLVLIKKIISRSENKKRKNFLFILFYFTIVLFSNYYGVSNYIYIEIPLLLSLFIDMWLKYGLDIKQFKKHETKKMLLIILTIVGLCFSFFLYKFLCQKVGFNSSITTGGMLSPDMLCSRFAYIFSSFLSMYGISGTSSLFTLSSIYICSCYLYMFLTVIVFPCYCIKNLKYVKDDFTRFLVLFSILENYILLFLIFFCGMGEGRYYLPAMLGNAIVAVISIQFIKRKFYNHCKNVLFVFIILFSLLSHLIAYKNFNVAGNNQTLCLEQLINPTIKNNVIDYLNEENLNYGFATFWNSYQLMIMSNSSIEIAAYDEGNPLMPYYFDINNGTEYYACSEDLYNPSFHKGRCFVLVKHDENIDETYYKLASKVESIDDFDVLVFDQNIHTYAELKA